MNIQSLRSNIRQLKSKYPAPAIAGGETGGGGWGGNHNETMVSAAQLLIHN